MSASGSPELCAAWATLQRELDTWQAARLTATFWWRDDDAVAHTPQLESLDALSQAVNVPVSIAVIPARLQESLSPYITSRKNFSVLQHGYAHRSFANPGTKKIEMGGDRQIGDIAREIALGRASLGAAFGEHFLPVLVPPWNRIEARTYGAIDAANFVGVSSMWSRGSANPTDRLLQVNTHLDPVNWRCGMGFVGEYRALGQILSHLYARRTMRRDRDEPTGILTHHLVQEEVVWQFCYKLMERLNAHLAVRWLSARDIWSA